MKDYKALLDTDFLFKAHVSHDGDSHVLADKILEFEGYHFYYHEKILEELSSPGFSPDPVPWLSRQTESGKIICYTDSRIIDLLASVYGEKAVPYYVELFEKSCNAFEIGFFQEYYSELRLLPGIVSKNEFLEALTECDGRIPNKSSMGEKKSFVLIQTMQLIYPGKVVVFCSDDGRARRNIAAISDEVRCLSILSVFYKMMREGIDKETARPYFDSLCDFYKSNNQTSMKVWTANTSEKINVDVDKIFEDVFFWKF